MPDITVVTVANGTLAAATVQKVILTGAKKYAEILNATGTSAIYARTDGVDPTVGGAECYELPATINSLTLPIPLGEVRLISAGTPSFEVAGTTDPNLSVFT